MTLTLLTGGARSGKSAIAVRRAASYDGPVVFVATGDASDEEMAARIQRHQAERPRHWTTVEATRDVGSALAGVADDAMVLLDCLSLWVSNQMAADQSEATIVIEAERVARWCADRAAPVIVVTNEVGSGLVPMHPVGRAYRDVLGRVNVAFSRHAELAQLVVAGRTLRLELDDDGPAPDGPAPDGPAPDQPRS